MQAGGLHAACCMLRNCDLMLGSAPLRGSGGAEVIQPHFDELWLCKVHGNTQRDTCFARGRMGACVTTSANGVTHFFTFMVLWCIAHGPPVMKQPDSVQGLDLMRLNELSATRHWSGDV